MKRLSRLTGVLYLVLAVLLYVLLRPVDRTLSLFAAAVRLIYTAMLATILLDLFHAYRVVGGDEETALSALATFFVTGYGGAVSGVLIAVVLAGELSLVGWLLVRGLVPRAV